MKSVKFTREQLLNAECTHQEYYEQFLSPQSVLTVVENIGASRILESRHPFFSDIELAEWEHIGGGLPAAFGLANDTRTISASVCLAKAAANVFRRGTPLNS